jgi:hypothetical protein
VPAGAWQVLRLVPEQVLAESRTQSERFQARAGKPPSLAGLAMVLAACGLGHLQSHRRLILCLPDLEHTAVYPNDDVWSLSHPHLR